MRTLTLCVGLLVAAAFAGGATESKSVKLVGCLEHDTPASSALATSASQVTAFKLSAIDPDAFKSATGSAGIDTAGPAELRLRSDDDFELLDHVGTSCGGQGPIRGRPEHGEAGGRSGGLGARCRAVAPADPRELNQHDRFDLPVAIGDRRARLLQHGGFDGA